MFRSKTIQSKLFFNYSLLIIGIIIVFVLSFYFYISKILETKASESLYQISSHISTEFDSQLNMMNSTSTKILFSQPLSRLFFSDMFQLNKSTIDQQRQFNEILYSIIGYDKSVSQINMFRTTGEFASIGDNAVFSNISPEKIANVQWVNDTFDNKGNKLISLPHQDDWNLTQATVISLSRAFSPNWGTKETNILEVQQDYRLFTNIIENALVKPDSKISNEVQVYVFNKDAQLVYPFENKNSSTELYWEYVNKPANHNPTFSILNTHTNSEDMLAFNYSELSEWTVVAVESKSMLLKPIRNFQNFLLIIGFITILITLLISYLVSKTLTNPIKKIHSLIKGLNLTSLSPKFSSTINSNLNELEQLNYSFQDMRIRLQESLNEAISSRAYELEARMFALQAQMNPHFLYNTITNVSVMAEENGQQSIVEVCDSLSVMLRYISSEHAAPVKLRDEIEHTLNYLQLMKLRFEENIVFNIHVSEELLNVEFPKLIVQPIVENSMKYGINIDPPWLITVAGHSFQDRWELTIRDNGPGFTESELAYLLEQFETIDPLVKIPTLKINGMGLLNIYCRLKLLFGNKLTFHIGNHQSGGAVITICIKY